MNLASKYEQLRELTNAEMDALLEIPWYRLPDRIDAVIAQLPRTTPVCFRMDILSWIYQQQGVMSFEEIADRLTGYPNTTAAKYYLRSFLRIMQKSMLISIDNFAIVDGKAPPPDDQIGKGSLISLTRFGMIWLALGWGARLSLLGKSADRGEIFCLHRQLCNEEDEGKANDPYWVDNLVQRGRMATSLRAAKAGKNRPAVPTSVWDLGKVVK